MLLKSVCMLATRPNAMRINILSIFPKVKYSESARILQFLLNISLKQKYTAKNSENGNTTKYTTNPYVNCTCFSACTNMRIKNSITTCNRINIVIIPSDHDNTFSLNPFYISQNTDLLS